MSVARQEERKDSEKVILGRITGVYGVKGWVKVFSYTDPMEAIVDYSPWYIRPESLAGSARKDMAWTKIRLNAGKRHAKTIVAKLEHCNDRDSAQSYIGNEIAIERHQLEPLSGADEYYWRDLIGLRVINQQGLELGVVKSLMETGANDVLVVAHVRDIDAADASADDAGPEHKERLIPWVIGGAIIAVDLEQKVIEVDWDTSWDED